MGFHATGTVFWGYDLGDMTNSDWDFIGPAWLDPDEHEQQDPADVLAGALGIDRTDRSAVWRAERDHPVRLGYYGAEGGETYYRVAVQASERNAIYECTPLGDVTVSVIWRVDLDRFMTLMGLPVPDSDPGWFVTSSYG
jgi:hypothetical protein